MPNVLVDSYQRAIEYVRISVTDRCNLRCYYCMPKDFKDFIPHNDVLSDDEIVKIAKAFIACGASNIRITGGEPLVRPNIVGLLKRLSGLDGLRTLNLSTNGVLLKRYAKELVKSNISSINVSLDSLDQDKIIETCTKDCLGLILEGLDELKTLGFNRIKINMVVNSTVVVSDIERMVDFCMAKGYILRLIETMPFANIHDFIDIHTFLPCLIEKYHLVKSDKKYGNGPALYYQSQDSAFTLGLITPMSQHFCASCNRVRITCDGVLQSCLGNEGSLDLKPYLHAKSPVDLSDLSDDIATVEPLTTNLTTTTAPITTDTNAAKTVNARCAVSLSEGEDEELSYLMGAIRKAVRAKPKEHVFLNYLKDQSAFKINHVMTTTGG